MIYAENLIRRGMFRAYELYKKHLYRKFPIHEIELIEFIKTLDKDANCIDVGSNKGQVFDFLYRHCKYGNLMAVEPIEEHCMYLIRKYPNADIRQLALYDTVGLSKFYHVLNRSTTSGIKFTATSRAVEIRVFTNTLDNIYHGKVDFIKIDVEGAEFNVLKGAKKLLYTQSPIIIFESGVSGLSEYYLHEPAELYNFLSDLGYKISTVRYYLDGLHEFDRKDFLTFFLKGYTCQYIAYI